MVILLRKILMKNDKIKVFIMNVVSKLLIAAKFIVLGIGGFFLMISSFVVFLDNLYSPLSSFEPSVLTLALSLLVLTGGAFMTLYGIGEWHRRGYLFVIFSIPFSLLLGSIPGVEKFGNDLLFLLFIIGVPFATNFAVKRYYSRKKDLRLTKKE